MRQVSCGEVFEENFKRKDEKMYSVVSTAIVQGIRTIPVYVEADVSDGMPMFEMVGFISSEVKESKERVRTALRNSGYVLPPKRITVNFVPANIRKTGSCFDLPIALAVLSAIRSVSEEKLKYTFISGEVGLSGAIKPVNGILPMVAEAKERGYTSAIVPIENLREAQMVKGITVFGVSNIEEAICVLNGQAYNVAQGVNSVENDERKEDRKSVDFSDINGQKMLKRACEVAVSGMHNLLMVGPPGAGKTMTAMRIPTILPKLEEKEQMELLKIYSVCGLFGDGKEILGRRPFRSPHHTITAPGLIGGGNIPRPGEISLAHRGVLFLDELPEFQKNTLDALRQPLEDKMARLVRISGTYEYPADFMLVAAMNPCKCGYYPDVQKCRCSAVTIEHYLNRISQPLLDRIDICMEASRIPYEDLIANEKNESSEEIRARVEKVHKIQKERFCNENFLFNSQIPSTKIVKYCSLPQEQEKYMKRIYKQLNLTARSYHKILKVARTLADMDQSEIIEQKHLNEAVCYRNIDKKFWEGNR